MKLINSLMKKKVLFIPENITRLYLDIKGYLPQKRFYQFRKAWVLNNLIKGPKKRRDFQRKYGYVLPGVINISPTEKCNLRCLGCYSSSYNRREDMAIDKMEKIILEAKNLGIFFIGILGGEPLLRKDIFPLFERNKEVAFRISTNGTLVDSDILNSLKRAGNVVLFFSLEGFEQETDFWRGKGVFQEIQKNMLLLKQNRILFGFSALLHARNRDIIISEDFLDLMENLGNKFGIYFPYGPVGENQYYELVMDKEELKRSYEKLESFEPNYSILILNKEGFYKPKKALNYILNQGCQAGLSVHITPEGHVEPCNGIQFYTENIFEKSLDGILKSPFYREIFSAVQRNERRCLAIHEPLQALEIVEKHKAKSSNKNSFSNLFRYAQIISQKPLCGGLNSRINKELTKDEQI